MAQLRQMILTGQIQHGSHDGMGETSCQLAYYMLIRIGNGILCFHIPDVNIVGGHTCLYIIARAHASLQSKLDAMSAL